MNEKEYSDLLKKMNSTLLLTRGDVIKITKIKENKPGAIKVGEVYSGKLMHEFDVGKSIFLDSNAFMRGVLTSRVTEVIRFTSFWLSKTQNSIYVVEKIN